MAATEVADGCRIRLRVSVYYLAMRPFIRITILAMIVAALSPLATGLAETPPGGTFVDDDVNIHESSIEAISAAEITRGCNPPLNTRYCPSASVTRGAMAAFLVRALQLPAATEAGFLDTLDTEFADDINRLAAADITRGCNPPANTRFCPDSPVTREQMAAFLTRALDLPAGNDGRFHDDDGSVFETDIESLATAGITRGCNPPDNTRFCPTDNVTRAEMAAFLTRALGLEEIAVTPRPYVVDVVSRQEWGARAASGGFEEHHIDQITVHHAGGGRNTGPALYRIWQSWHQSLGWPDVAYHFFIGPEGQVFEGRPYAAASDTATDYDTKGHLLIVVEGDFDSTVPTSAQLESLARLVAWASSQFDVRIDTISGHRDHAATACPGDNLYAKIHDGSVAARAGSIAAEGGATLVISG